jgi:predicted dehydrogenase
MKIGLIGYGSIGKRHAANLLELGQSDITLLRSIGSGNEQGLKETADINEFLSADFDCIIISNPTSKHLESMIPFIERDMNLFVEKPVVATREQSDQLKLLLNSYTGKGMVGFNMRFHPCIKKVKEITDSEIYGKPLFARLFVGQYLPDWRPGRDYRNGVSALRELGGGVVIELIHEIDLSLFLFGNPVNGIKSYAEKISGLEIETEDISEILFKSEKGILVSVHQDYLYRGYRRTIEVICENGTVNCDLKDSVIVVTGENGQEIYSERIPFERNDMYISMMRYYLSCLQGNIIPAPSLAESVGSFLIAADVKTENNL